MALDDITFSTSEHDMDRGDIWSVIDIVFPQSFNLPLISWGGGGFSVLSSPIIKTIRVWR